MIFYTKPQRPAHDTGGSAVRAAIMNMGTVCYFIVKTAVWLGGQQTITNRQQITNIDRTVV